MLHCWQNLSCFIRAGSPWATAHNKCKLLVSIRKTARINWSIRCDVDYKRTSGQGNAWPLIVVRSSISSLLNRLQLLYIPYIRTWIHIILCIQYSCTILYKVYNMHNAVEKCIKAAEVLCGWTLLQLYIWISLSSGNHSFLFNANTSMPFLSFTQSLTHYTVSYYTILYTFTL